jgi:hypothetical protein
MLAILRATFMVAVLMPVGVAAGSPRDAAEAFVGHLLSMEIHQAVELIAEPDRSAADPLGKYDSLVSSPPRFPSRWSFEVSYEDTLDGGSTVGIAITHPEIETSLRRTSSASLEELALKQYFEGNLEMTSFEIEVALIKVRAGQWSVRTFAEEDEWQRWRYRLPQADVMAMNRDEILDYRRNLLDRFPHRANEISALIGPELSVLEAAESLTFSNLSVIDDRTRERSLFSEPAYDIRLSVTNGSSHTITRISGQMVLRNADGDIIDSYTWVFNDSDAPAGLRPGETFSSAAGVKIENLDAKVATVEVQVSDLDIR